MTDLKTGDVVRLKSGGPKMTLGVAPTTIDGAVVAKASVEGLRRCHWFERDQPRYAIYHVDQLFSVEDTRPAN